MTQHIVCQAKRNPSAVSWGDKQMVIGDRDQGVSFLAPSALTGVALAAAISNEMAW
jgi:hypothetical protein